MSYLTKRNSGLMPRSISRELSDFFNEFDSLLTWTPYRSLINKDSDWSPKSDIVENENDYQIALDLPGIPLENINIEAKDGTLTISGERTQENETNGKRFHRVERSYGKFVRSFTLPDDIIDNDITASFKNGTLTVSIPKPAKTVAEPDIKKIEIKSEE